MIEAICSQPGYRRFRTPITAVLACMLALGSFTWTPVVRAAGDDPEARDLSVQQKAVFTVQAPAPQASESSEALSVVAWVDHEDNTYAVGEAVRLFVRANKDAYLTVLNVGPSGSTTLLYPNATQTDTHVRAGQVVEIPGRDSGVSIRVSGPVGRELIKVIASTSPAPVFEGAKLTGGGPFLTVVGDSQFGRARPPGDDGRAAQRSRMGRLQQGHHLDCEPMTDSAVQEVGRKAMRATEPVLEIPVHRASGPDLGGTRIVDVGRHRAGGAGGLPGGRPVIAAGDGGARSRRDPGSFRTGPGGGLVQRQLSR